jgi:hypothetical protein
VVGTWAEVAAAATDTLVIGEVDPAGEAVLQSASVRFINSVRQAGHLAAIAWRRFEAGQVDSADTLTPLYALQPKSGT